MTRETLLQIAKPILFNTEMVQAILAGRKTVTRRVVKPQPNDMELTGVYGNFARFDNHQQHVFHHAQMPYTTGNHLYVRETWYYESHMYEPSEGNVLYRYVYRADQPDYPVNVGVGKHGWRPSIHMPKEAARIFLRVTDVWVERLQDITAEEIMREGAKNCGEYIDLAVRTEADTAWYKAIFEALWNSTIKKPDLAHYGWNANPWVWVIEFERMEAHP